MKYLKSYILFLESKQVVLAELYFSDRFEKILKQIYDENSNSHDNYIVAKYLLNIIYNKHLKGSYKEHTMTYIDITDKNDTISFLPATKVQNSTISGYKQSGRNEIKVGRFVRTLTTLNLNNFTITDKQIENFVNIYKAMIDRLKNRTKLFSIVNGEDIAKFYKSENYSRNEDGNLTGSLAGSCMNDDMSYLKLYTDNPEVVSMVILRNEKNNDLIDGRALLWKLENPKGKIFLDRIYTTKDSDVNLFLDYAKSNGWLYKKSQSWGNNVEGADFISTTLKVEKYREYPYLDTLKYFNPETGEISSTEFSKRITYYDLSSSGGGYTLHKGVEVAWDGYRNREDEKRNLVWCRLNNGYCNIDDARYLNYIDEYVYPNDDRVVYSKIERQSYLLDDAVRSKTQDTYILKRTAKVVIIDSEGNTDYMSPRDFNIRWFSVGDKNYINTMGFKDIDDEWILKSEGIKVYQREDVKNAYMTEEDSKKYNVPIEIYNGKYLSKDRYEYQRYVGIIDKLDDKDRESYNKIKDSIEKDVDTDSPYYTQNLLNKYKGLSYRDAQKELDIVRNKYVLDELRHKIDYFKNQRGIYGYDDDHFDRYNSYDRYKYYLFCIDLQKIFISKPSLSKQDVIDILVPKGYSVSYIDETVYNAADEIRNIGRYASGDDEYRDLNNYMNIIQ